MRTAGIVCVLLAASIASAADTFEGIDGSTLGTSKLPIWSHLTTFEQRALGNLNAARAGDPDALLALYIIAAGNKREQGDFERYRTRIRGFVGRVRSKIEAAEGDWQKGYELHRAMHAEFFPRGWEKNELRGYLLHQSQLTEIFETRTYNCISSTLLFIVVARHFEFDVDAVVLPSHAFVQWRAAGGKTYEIETTSNTGFDWVHDEKFYSGPARAWSASRGFGATTYQQYLKRQILSPVEIAASNMRNQHVQPSRMSLVDRSRLSEIRSFLLPDDEDATHARLSIQGAISYELRRAKDFTNAHRLLARLDPTLPDLTRKWSGSPEILNRIYGLRFRYGVTLHDLGRYREAFTHLDPLMLGLPNELKHHALYSQQYYAVLGKYLAERANEGAFEEIETLLLRKPMRCAKVGPCAALLAWLYSAWGHALATEKNWSGAIGVYDRYLSRKLPGEATRKIASATEIVYLHWARDFSLEGNWPQVRKVLETCLDKCPEAKKCEQQLVDLESRHRLE